MFDRALREYMHYRECRQLMFLLQNTITRVGTADTSDADGVPVVKVSRHRSGYLTELLLTPSASAESGSPADWWIVRPTFLTVQFDLSEPCHGPILSYPTRILGYSNAGKIEVERKSRFQV